MYRCVTPPSGTSENQWIEKCRLGDRDAFRELYDTYRDRIYSIAFYSLNGDSAAAEDVVQDVFVKVFQHITTFRSESEFATWIYRITHNACDGDTSIRLCIRK